MATLAPSLARLRSELNRKFPKRSTKSDGWLGDTAHSRRPSDHNPDRQGIVHALDVTVDTSEFYPATLLRAAFKHPSTNYVIHNKVIYSRRYGFQPRRYLGENPHTTHVHISILHTRAARNSKRSWFGTPWTLPKGVVLGRAKSKLRWNGTENANSAAHVRTLQRSFRIAPVGRYGPITELAVKREQKRQGQRQTGVFGPVQWRRRGLG
jgi:peptidoglycan hydrolase-like protein with peptidoglycan-binding domain